MVYCLGQRNCTIPTGNRSTCAAWNSWFNDDPVAKLVVPHVGSHVSNNPDKLVPQNNRRLEGADTVVDVDIRTADTSCFALPGQ